MVHEFSVDEHGKQGSKKKKKNQENLCSMSTDISLTKYRKKYKNNAKMAK